MKNNIRFSAKGDSTAFVDIKQKLPLPTKEQQTSKGGFLLGTDKETYEFYISQGICLTAYNGDDVVGFGIILPDHLIKGGELWEKRTQVDWTIDIEMLENANVAYLEQLAFLSGNKKLSVILAYNLMHLAFYNGAEFVLTTTVRKPVKNKAAIPFILAAGGSKVGNINEAYPTIGAINSDIYLTTKEQFYRNVKKLPFYNTLKINQLDERKAHTLS